MRGAVLVALAWGLFCCAYPPARSECVSKPPAHCTADGWCSWQLLREEELGWDANTGETRPTAGLELRTIHGSTTSNVWVGLVGNRSTVPNPALGRGPGAMHWDGCGWQQGLMEDLHVVAVHAAPQDTAWILGRTASTTALWRWNGASSENLAGRPWNENAPQNGTFMVQWLADNDVWMTDGMSMARFTGQQLLMQPLPAGPFWSDAEETVVPTAGALLRSGTGTPVTTPVPPGEEPVAAWGLNARDVWWVTRQGLAFHYNGQTLDQMERPASSLSMVHGQSGEHLHVCNAGRCFRWNGRGFREIRVPRDTLLTGMWTAPNGRLWLATRDGRVMVQQW